MPCRDIWGVLRRWKGYMKAVYIPIYIDIYIYFVKQYGFTQQASDNKHAPKYTCAHSIDWTIPASICVERVRTGGGNEIAGYPTSQEGRSYSPFQPFPRTPNLGSFLPLRGWECCRDHSPADIFQNERICQWHRFLPHPSLSLFTPAPLPGVVRRCIGTYYSYRS